MPSRRTFLRWGAAAAAVAAFPLGELMARAATTLPLTVVNNTGQFADSAIWLYIVGVAPNGQQAYVQPDGTLTPVSTSLNGADGFADLSIPIDATVNLPNMSGRIYFSVNDKLPFRVVTDGNGNPALQYPAGWVSGDPSYDVLHDWVEFTFNGSGMFCNTTMVDMFGIPLAIELDGANQQTTGTLVSGGRDAIFNGIAGQSGFGELVLSNGLRVIAPGHGIDSGVFSSTYYDAYVNQVWTTYANTDLTVDINGTTYTGSVSGDQLVFDNGGGSFTKPTTQNIFYCAGALAPPGGNAGPVAADLGAAFNRSTLLTFAQQPVGDPADFYQDPTTNHYSRIIHENTADGHAYGFPFDDVSGFSSFIQDTAPNAITVTLTPF